MSVYVSVNPSGYSWISCDVAEYFLFSEVYNAHVDFRFLKSTWLFHMLLDDVWGWQRDIWCVSFSLCASNLHWASVTLARWEVFFKGCCAPKHPASDKADGNGSSRYQLRNNLLLCAGLFFTTTVMPLVHPMRTAKYLLLDAYCWIRAVNLNSTQKY